MAHEPKNRPTDGQASDGRYKDQSPPPAEPTPGGEAMDLISSMEAQLETVKRARAKQEEVEQRFAQQQQELAQREQQLQQASAELDEARSALSEHSAELDESKRSLQKQRDELARAREELSKEREQNEHIAKQLHAANDQLSSERRELETQRAATGKLRAEVEEHQLELKEKSDQLQQRIEQIERERIEHQSELEAKEAELQEATNTLESAIAHASERAGVLSRERDKLEQERRQLSAQTGDQSDRIAALEEQLAEAQSQLDRTNSSSSEAVEQIRELTDRCVELEGKRADLEKAHGDLEELRQVHQQSQAKTAEDEQQLAALQAELVARSEVNNKLTAELDDVQSAAEAVRAQIQAKNDEVDRLNKAFNDSASGSNEQIEALTQQISAQLEGIKTLEGEKEQAQKELRATRKQLSELEEQISVGGAEVASAQQLASLKEGVAKRDTAIAQLQQQLDKTKRWAQKMQQRVESASADGEMGPDHDEEFMNRRRERLRRYKKMLRDQSGKILQAREVLTTRSAEYERLLQKRIELAEVKACLEKKATSLQSQSSRNKVAIAIMAFVSTIGILGALSWSVAQRAIPATHIMQATIAVQEEGEAIAPEHLVSWTAAIEQIADDPRLMEMAAERMKRRGILDLSTPGDLGARLNADLDLLSTQPGQVTLALKGEGVERTARTLETYTAALIAIANEGKSRRNDRAMTAMTQGPNRNADPIDQPHIVVAGMIWAGSSLGALLIGLIAWAKLARARRKFEEENPILHSLDESRWPQMSA